MGKTLLSNLYIRHTILFSTLLLILSGLGELRAQVSIQDIRSFEMEFGTESDITSDNRWVINPMDIPSSEALLSVFPFDSIDVSAPPDSGNQAGYFLLNRGGETLIAVRPGQGTGGGFVNLDILNNTDALIDRLHFTIDFAFRKTGDRPISLTLTLQPLTEPGNVDNDRIFSTQSSGTRSQEWQTAGVDFLLEDLYLGVNESLELNLSWDAAAGEDQADEIAIQRVELLPGEFEFSGRYDVGDLVITEVFPSDNTDNRSLNYIELYNRTGEDIDLAGWSIRSGETTGWIRESLTVEPYGMVVIANSDPAGSGIDPDYILPDLVIPSHGGIIDLMYGDNRIIRAAYDERRGGSAWELRSVTAADNGYLSIGDFRTSGNSIQGDLFGSPGGVGDTERVFTRTLDYNNSWQLLSVPGFLLRSDNRDIYHQNEPGGNPGITQPVLPGLGFLAGPIENEASTSRLEARENSSQSVTEVNPVTTGNGWQLLGNPYEEEIGIGQLGVINEDFSWKVAQVWDPVRHTFRLTTLQNNRIEPWQGFLVQNNRGSNRIRFERRSESDVVIESTTDDRERYISFELTGQDQQQNQFHDDAAVLYFHNGAGYGADDYESEKLWPYFVQGQEVARASILYFVREQQAATKYLAQMSRPYNTESAFEVRLGHASLHTSGTFTVSWPDLFNIPETWSLTLVDNQTGATVDMREESGYQFESSPYTPDDVDYSDNPGIFPVQDAPSDNRFSVIVDPNPVSAESEHTEGEDPDSPQLYRNYPNPFDQATTIRFYLPEARHVRIVVYNLLGQPVAELLDEVRSEGEYDDVMWDASNMPSGLYIVSLELDNRRLTREVIYTK